MSSTGISESRFSRAISHAPAAAGPGRWGPGEQAWHARARSLYGTGAQSQLWSRGSQRKRIAGQEKKAKGFSPAEQRIGSPLLFSFDCGRGAVDCLRCLHLNMFAQNMMTKSWNQPRWPDVTAPIGSALSCRLIGIRRIRREWTTYGKLGTDVLLALASLRSEPSPGIDYRTCQRLSDWAKTVCDLYTIDLSSTFTCKAEAVGKRIHLDRGGGTVVDGCGGLSWEQAPVVYLLRNVPPKRVQRPYALVPPHRHPVDHIWRLKTVARS